MFLGNLHFIFACMFLPLCLHSPFCFCGCSCFCFRFCFSFDFPFVFLFAVAFSFSFASSSDFFVFVCAFALNRCSGPCKGQFPPRNSQFSTADWWPQFAHFPISNVIAPNFETGIGVNFFPILFFKPWAACFPLHSRPISSHWRHYLRIFRFQTF